MFAVVFFFMWYVSVKSGKIKAIKMPGSLGSVYFIRTSAALLIIQKQLMPVFLAIPSQYCLKCVVISLRLYVSNCDSGLVVHALEAAINLLPIGFLCIFGSQ